MIQIGAGTQYRVLDVLQVNLLAAKLEFTLDKLVVLVHVTDEVIPCFETDGESMDVYMACE